MESELDEKQALLNLRHTEIRFHLVKLIVIIAAAVLTSIAIVSLIRQDNARNLQLINDKNAQTAADIKKAISDNSETSKRFLCSLALQLVKSTQTVDDCVAQNKVSESPKVRPQ